MRGFELLRLLSSGQFFSGQSLAKHLNVSRTAIWNKIQHLKALGLDIYAVQGKGYRLADPLELLDTKMIVDAMSPKAGGRLSIDTFPEVDSTNRYLLQRMYESSEGKIRTCLAEHQTAGRGRRGRQWVSPFGANVYMSLLWRFERGLEAIEGLSLAVALALVRSCEALDINDVGIKWPNDIYFKNRKLAGILLEMSGEASGPCFIVIGIGVNVNMSRLSKAGSYSVDDTQAENGSDIGINQPWVDLSEIVGTTISRNRLVAVLLENLLEVMDDFEQRGFAPLMARWQKYDVLFGKDVNVSDMKGVRQGIAKGIDASGAFLLETSTGLQRILSGDVSVRLAEESI